MQGVSPVSNLSTIQKEFQAQLLDKKSDFANLVMTSNELTPETRINIYKHGYRARLVDTLADNYPKLRQYLGDDKFHKLANHYLNTHPSNFRSIRWFGDKLSIFLREQQPYCKFPILAELAQFEWAIEATFDAVDKTIQTVEEFKSIPPEAWGKMTFTFHPSLHCIEFKYNVVSIWESISKDSKKRAIRLKTPRQVLFWRHELETFYRVLSPMEACILKGAINGNSFATLCENMEEWMLSQDIANTAANLLLKWLTTGIIIQ